MLKNWFQSWSINIIREAKDERAVRKKDEEAKILILVTGKSMNSVRFAFIKNQYSEQSWCTP
jgi:hypothetical protein